MNTQKLAADSATVHEAIHRLALSLDSFIVNGIQYGVLQQTGSNGFLDNLANSLLGDLANLARLVHSPQPRTAEVMASLSEGCRKLVDMMIGLRSFRAFPEEQVRDVVSQISTSREESVQLIEELERCVRSPHPFYRSRPPHAAAMVIEFMTNLERCMIEERTSTRESPQLD